MKWFSIKNRVNQNYSQKTHKVIGKESICYNLPFYTHDEKNFHHSQILTTASGTHTEWILNRDKKNTKKVIKKTDKKLLQRHNVQSQTNSRFTAATNLKIGTYVLILNYVKQKGISKKLQQNGKGPFQIIGKPTDVTYKLFDSNKKEIDHHRNSILTYYPKEHALRKLTQLYSFTGLKVVHDNSDNNHQQINDANCSTQLLESNKKI